MQKSLLNVLIASSLLLLFGCVTPLSSGVVGNSSSGESSLNQSSTDSDSNSNNNNGGSNTNSNSNSNTGSGTTTTNTNNNNQNPPDIYQPDNGPTHEGGTIINVSNEAQFLNAIDNASAGDVITLWPGTYNFNQLIRLDNDGSSSAPIFIRANRQNEVVINLSHIENFKITGKWWIIENIKFYGNCTNSTDCEHAFHIVADADDVHFRNNEVVNFASHVKVNAEVVGAGPAKSFPDRLKFINNYWHNDKYIYNQAPHNILNIDGGKDHVVRGNIFADFNTPETLPRSASAVYPKASTLRILIEQNLIVCEKNRVNGETTRGIQLGDGAPASICDGDIDGDGNGDCIENGQSQEALVRNNVIMNCNNGGSSAGIMASSDRESKIYHNTVYGTSPRKAGFYVGHPDFDTFWQFNIMEEGIDLNYANRPLNEIMNYFPLQAELNSLFTSPADGDFSLAQSGSNIMNQVTTDINVQYDFCGYPRGSQADLGAVEYSTAHSDTNCFEIIKQMYEAL